MGSLSRDCTVSRLVEPFFSLPAEVLCEVVLCAVIQSQRYQPVFVGSAAQVPHSLSYTLVFAPILCPCCPQRRHFGSVVATFCFLLVQVCGSSIADQIGRIKLYTDKET